MKKTTNLDSLIHEVEGMNAPHHKGEEVVIRILLNPERHFWELKQEKYFLVSKRIGRDCSGDLDVSIEDHALDLRLDLNLAYRLRFGPEPLKSAAGEIAQALYDPEGPQHKFESLLKEWVDHYVKESGGPHRVMLEFFDQQPRLVTFLQRSARELLHLDLFRVTIEPRTDTAAKDTEELAPFTVSAVFKDYENPVALKVEVLTLDISECPEKKVLAYIKGGRKAQLRVAIERKLVDTIRGRYKLHHFHGLSISPAVKQFLKGELGETAEAFGRSIRAFDLRSDSPILKLQEFYQFNDLSFQVRVPSHPKAVSVTAVIHLELDDLGLYAGSGSVDLREWARRTLESVTVSRLSRYPYLRLAEQWGREKLLIGQELERRAVAIGFRSTFCELSADLPLDLIHQNFRISIVDEELTTDNSEWKIPVGIEASVTIDNIAVLAEKWPTEVQIDNKIRESLIFVMHRVGKEHSPKEWYLNFDESKDQFLKPMKRILQDAIEEHLRTEFGGKLLSFTVTRKLVQKLAALREQIPSVDVSVTRAGFKTKLAYHVVDVDPNMWHRFQAAAPTIDELTKRIIRHVEQRFADHDPVAFRRRENATNMALLNDPESEFSVRSLVLTQYGLQVYVDHWRRETTELDAQEDKLLTVSGDEEQFDIEHLQDEKKAIRKKIMLLNPIYDKDDIQILEDRLTELDRRIKGYRPAALESVLKTQAERKDRQVAESLGHAPRSSKKGPDDENELVHQPTPMERAD